LTGSGSFVAFRKRVLRAVRQAAYWGDRRLPWGARTALGLLLVVFGMFGFLPVLGFWMIPVGLAFVALDVPPLRRRLLLWLDRRGDG